MGVSRARSIAVNQIGRIHTSAFDWTIDTSQSAVGFRRLLIGFEVRERAKRRDASAALAHNVLQPVDVVTRFGQQRKRRRGFVAPISTHIRMCKMPDFVLLNYQHDEIN